MAVRVFVAAVLAALGPVSVTLAQPASPGPSPGPAPGPSPGPAPGPGPGPGPGPLRARPSGPETSSAVDRVFARIERLTGRAFASRPRVEILDAAQWSARVRERFSARFHPQSLSGLGVALRTLGVVPADVDLGATWVDWAAPASGAYFDATHDTLVVRLGDEEPLRDHGELVRAALLALRASSVDLAALDVADATLLSDRARAFEALAEGEARYWTRRYGMLYSDELADEFVTRAPTEWTHELAPLAAPRVPAFVVAHTTFAAEVGERYVEALHDAGGVDAIERAWRLPPRSTEQVLWPEKASESEGVDEPHAVVARDITDLLPPGFVVRFDGEFGAAGTELVLRLAADPTRALLAQRGFGGDRMRAYAHQDGRVIVQWVIASDSTADAIEAFDAARKLLERMYAPTKDAANRIVVDAEQVEARATTLADEVLGAVRRKADTIVVFTGVDQTIDVERLELRALE